MVSWKFFKTNKLPTRTKITHSLNYNLLMNGIKKWPKHTLIPPLGHHLGIYKILQKHVIQKQKQNQEETLEVHRHTRNAQARTWHPIYDLWPYVHCVKAHLPPPMVVHCLDHVHWEGNGQPPTSIASAALCFSRQIGNSFWNGTHPMNSYPLQNWWVCWWLPHLTWCHCTHSRGCGGCMHTHLGGCMHFVVSVVSITYSSCL